MNVHTPPADIAAAPAVRIAVAAKTWPPVAGRPAHTILRAVNLDIAPRSFVVVSGPSGCGKSTLLNIVAGLDQDYTGSIAFGAADARLAFIFQSPRLLPWKSVQENIEIVLPDGDRRRANIPELLSRVGLSGAQSVFPERLSLGMQRRVAIARGFVVEPDILLMDEPFVSLDDPTADALRTLVLELWHRHPTTVLFVTHDRREAVRLATRIIRLGGPDATAVDEGGTAISNTAGRQSSVVADHDVTLSLDERCSAERLHAEQVRVFGA
jgi:NitT/TauT family transport system ATP-binding protein